jgi:hypothetical protein
MLDVDNLARFLLGRRLLDSDAIVDGSVSIRSVARRNRNLRVEGPPGRSYLVKQPDDPADGGFATLRHEAAFHRACREDPSGSALLEFLPRLVHHDEASAVLVFDLLSDATTLRSQLEDPSKGDRSARAARALGRALATAHRLCGSTATRDRDGWGWLPRDAPSVMGLREPDLDSLSRLSAAHFQLLRILQGEPDFNSYFEEIQQSWRPKTLIHGDVRFDNVLVGPPAEGDEDLPRVWITDWEMVRLGDPAWDLAGALQEFVVLWIASMPLPEDGRAEGVGDGAGVPMDGLRIAARAIWTGYREGSGLASGELGLLRRAVALCPARLIQSAYEFAAECDDLPGQSVLLLQVAANLLADPESGRIEFFGIAPEYGLS